MVANQSILFFKFLLAGIIFGFIIGIFKLIKIFFNNKIIIFVMDFLICLLFTFTYIFLINKYNLGESRFYLILSLILGTLIQRNSLGKLFAKFYFKLYNKFKVFKSNFLKTKFGKYLSK